MAQGRERAEPTRIDDSTIQALVLSGATADATTLAVRKYGREIAAWLGRVSRHPQDARDAFSIFLECLWGSLSKFRWESSLRTWIYCLARASCARVARRKCLEEPLDEELEPMLNCTRSATKPWLSTDVKVHFARLREGLSGDERLLLSLRVDRQMDWLEIAQVTRGTDCSPSDPALRRHASNLRKQFERIKARLRTLGVAEGLIPSE